MGDPWSIMQGPLQHTIYVVLLLLLLLLIAGTHCNVQFSISVTVSIRALYIPGGAYVFHQEYQEQHPIYIYIVFGFLQFDLFVCQVYDRQL